MWYSGQDFEDFERRVMQQQMGSGENLRQEVGVNNLTNESGVPGENDAIAGGSNPALNQSANMDVTQMMTTINALVQQNAQMLNLLMLNQRENRNETSLNNDSDRDSSQRGEIQNFNVMPDLSKTIDNFNAEKGPQAAKLWLQQLESTAMLHRWPDAFILQTARTHMVGAAKFWMQGQGPLSSWTEFREAFTKTFIFKRNKTEIWKRMQDRIQGPRESVNSYYHEKVALCNELNLDFEEVKEQVLIGLWSKDLSTFLLAKRHDDVNDLYHDIVSFERVNDVRRGRVIEKKDHERGKQERKEIVREDTKKESGAGKVLRCYNCNQSGHISTNCPKPVRPKGSCYGCGSTEHQKRDCPQDKPNVVKEQKQVGLLEESQDPVYVVSTYIDKYNVLVDTVLDSGSPISLLSASLINDMSDIEPVQSFQNYFGIND